MRAEVMTFTFLLSLNREVASDIAHRLHGPPAVRMGSIWISEGSLSISKRSPVFMLFLMLWMGFPGGAVGKESACQCRRHKKHRFDPWVGKIPWRGKWQPSLGFLPGKFHRQRRLAGPSPWGGKELDTTEHTRTHAVNTVINKIHFTLDKNNRSSHFFLENNTSSFLILFSLKPSLTCRRFTCARWAQDVADFRMEH